MAEGEQRDRQTLSSSELSFAERLRATDEGDMLLAEWQLALSLHQYSTGAYKNACQHVLPVFFGGERYADKYKDEAGAKPLSKLVGFNSIWGEIEDKNGEQVGLKGRDGDESGFFSRKPLAQQQRLFNDLFKTQSAAAAPQTVIEAARLSPQQVVGSMFSKQGLFANDLVHYEPPACSVEPPPKLRLQEAIASANLVFFHSETCTYFPTARKAVEEMMDARSSEFGSITVKYFDLAPYKEALPSKVKHCSSPSVWIRGVFVGGCHDGKHPAAATIRAPQHMYKV